MIVITSHKLKYAFVEMLKKNQIIRPRLKFHVRGIRRSQDGITQSEYQYSFWVYFCLIDIVPERIEVILHMQAMKQGQIQNDL